MLSCGRSSIATPVPLTTSVTRAICGPGVALKDGAPSGAAHRSRDSFRGTKIRPVIGGTVSCESLKFQSGNSTASKVTSRNVCSRTLFSPCRTEDRQPLCATPVGAGYGKLSVSFDSDLKLSVSEE